MNVTSVTRCLVKLRPVLSTNTTNQLIHRPQLLSRHCSGSVSLSGVDRETMNGFAKHTKASAKEEIRALAADKKGLVVAVEGNIGCGKTTMLNYFKDLADCEIVAEPVEKWRNIDGHNALGMFYQDQSRWAMALQTYVQLTMLQNHTKPLEKPIRLMERSIFSAKYCFVDNLIESNMMPPMEHIILTKWFDWIVETQNVKVDLIVYLQTDPEILHARIKSRCRHEEEGIPLSYLKALHQRHEDWLIHKKSPCPAEVLVIDANCSLGEMEVQYEEHRKKILAQDACN